MDLELLKRFYIVAQEGTVGKGAERIHVAQSALTRSINLFEHQLNTKLFERIPKGMQLTPQGERLYGFAKQILEQADSFEKFFHEKEDELSGEIKIITTPFFCSSWLIPNLKGFLERYPDINIKILQRTENLDPTEADVVIATLIPHQPYLIQKSLFTIQIQLFAGQSYLNKFGIPEKVEDLDFHRLITYRGNYHTNYGSTNWVLNIGIKEGQSSRKSYLEVDSLQGMLNSALEGYGIVELPNLSVVLNSELKIILPERLGPEVDMYYIFPEKRKNSKKINLLFEHLSKKGK